MSKLDVIAGLDIGSAQVACVIGGGSANGTTGKRSALTQRLPRRAQGGVSLTLMKRPRGDAHL